VRIHVLGGMAALLAETVDRVMGGALVGVSMRTAAKSFDAQRSTINIPQAQILHLHVFVDAVRGAFAPQAALLDAAKGHVLGGNQAGVDAHHAVFERLGHAEDAAHVARIKVARQAELGGVGRGYGLLLGAEAKYRRQRPESFFARAQHAGIGFGDDGRLEELALHPLAAGDEPAALADGVLHMLLDLVHGGVLDQRALRDAGLEAVADFQLRDPGGKFLDEGVVHAVLHIQPVGTHAGLPGVAVFAGDGAFDRRIDVGIVKHDERRVAAQLQRQLFDGGRALRHEHAAHFGGAGKRQVPYHAACAQRLADGARVAAGNDVDYARRQSGAHRQLGGGQRGERRQPGGFDDHRTAGGQRGGDLARDHRQRKVPRRDGRAHADGLANHHNALGRVVRGQRLAVDALGLLGKPFDEAGPVSHFALGLGQWLALLGGHDAGQVVLMRHQQTKPVQQQRVAPLAGERAPGRPGGIGGGYGLLRVRGAQVGHVGQLGTGGRIGHVKARRPGDPQSADQGIGAQQRAVLELGKRGVGGVHGWQIGFNSLARLVAGWTVLPRIPRLQW